MALRLDTARFAQISHEELTAWQDDPTLGPDAMMATSAVDDSSDPVPLAAVSGQVIILRKKPIQALVDTEEAAREIVRNLLRWALEEMRRQATAGSASGSPTARSARGDRALSSRSWA